MSKFVVLTLILFFSGVAASATRHGDSSLYPTYRGLVMTGYQGWFRVPGDGSGRGWVHYGAQGQFDPEHNTVDFWPDVSEYEKTYDTPFLKADGTPAKVFSSYDKSTTDLHFRWMQQYQIDGAFMQRFYGTAKNRNYAKDENVILANVVEAAGKYQRAIAMMYDLSGLTPGEDCSPIIEDWKELVDRMKITSQGAGQTYLYHEGKPVVGIWGVGFPDRPYNIRNIGLEQLIDFLQNDPEYGGCAVMLGVPAYFRDLNVDTTPDPYLQEIVRSADIIFPWVVQRFTPLLHNDLQRYYHQVRKDIDWCHDASIDYAAVVYPGFSWNNLSQPDLKRFNPPGAIPRQIGSFYWGMIHMAIEAGAEMLYVAMFDEIDEGTCIFKCTNDTPVGEGVQFMDYEEAPSDYYLSLTQQAKIKLTNKLAEQVQP